jgi:hypothetical protein
LVQKALDHESPQTTAIDFTIGTTIWQQISTTTKMACGARQPVATRTGLMFRVTYRNTRTLNRIAINLNGMDLNDVQLVKINQQFGRTTTLEAYKGVYCDDLSNLIHKMVNK